ncbi:D-xylulose reductase [Kaistia hirudinis]|uniref:D-xylulose reductase n=1 Tax=Kaistia hirudinis TaxID=1293440 RepID=A0A840APC1_9HYPH|nr:NAD(P)-dependent alcohol dehydrogenase [Kaistia hirudinis]MBB3932200.1 D-xylulose reductase [Kaistia hirudinis]
MRALVLEERLKLSLRDIELPQAVGPRDVKIAIHTVGVCGSDVHYYTHGRIGPFIVEEPMVLGHEASGTVVEIGAEVKGLKVGDRVCMEPGIPDLSSRASKLGLYNVDPSVRFWATPPVHGCLTPFVVFPEAFTFKLPDNVSFAEGAMVEPFAVGMQAASKAKIAPGDTALVIGSGPIGIMVALAALAGGCSRVYISDHSAAKLEIAGRYDGIEPIKLPEQSVGEVIAAGTDGWGVDIVFEAAGARSAYDGIFGFLRPGGAVVLVGMPVEPVAIDIVSAQAKEARIETIFRYANVYDRAIALISSGKVNLKPLVTGVYPFEESIAAFERAASADPHDVKLQILMG